MRRGGWLVVALTLLAALSLAAGCASIIGVGDDVVVTPSDASDEGETGTD